MVATKNSLAQESLEKDILPYIPYLYQDLWEMGSDSDKTLNLIRNYVNYNDCSVLDLCCGKGALGISLAESIGVKIKGIDNISEFLEEGRKRAKLIGVGALCEFELGHIDELVPQERGYNIVLCSSSCCFLGKVSNILDKLKSVIVDDGCIIINNWVSIDGIHSPTNKQWLSGFVRAKLKLIKSIIIDETKIIQYNRVSQDHIENRVYELENKYPDKKQLFRDFVKFQQKKFDIIETELIGVIWLLKKT